MLDLFCTKRGSNTTKPEANIKQLTKKTLPFCQIGAFKLLFS